ncbi:unnamed protein product [Pichia kudriavzevii]
MEEIRGGVSSISPSQTKKEKNQSKKSKGSNRAPKIPNVIPKKDHFQRVSYLYKLGAMMTMAKYVGDYDQHQQKQRDTLSRTYLNQMDLVSKKAVLKLHPSIKRTICKQCSRLLVEGLTCSIRVVNESKRQQPHCDVLELKCVCGRAKRFPIGKNFDYSLFSERENVLHDSI